MCKGKSMGYIKLFRKITEWEWFNDPNVLVVWIHLLLDANWEDGEWRGIKVPRGSLVTSLPRLSAETGLTIKQLRIVLDKLERGTIIGRKRAGERAGDGTMITICKYEDYQGKNIDEGTIKGSERARKRASIKEYKNINNTLFSNSSTSSNEDSEEYERESDDCSVDSSDAEFIYKLYPGKCPVKGRPTGKSRKDIEKIKRLLKTMKKDDLAGIINRYLKDCVSSGTPIKNLSTFLNNIPDYSDVSSGPKKEIPSWAKEGERYSFSFFMEHERELHIIGEDLRKHVLRGGAIEWVDGEWKKIG